MGSAERRERERTELRGKILDAARELFVADGYEAVTMRRIAQKIEYSPTAIYLHFKDKPELVAELVAKDFAALAMHFAKLSTIEDPVERLVRCGRAYVDFGLANPNHYMMMFVLPRPMIEPKEQDHFGDPQRDAYAFLRTTVEDCMRANRLRPELTDPELVAQTLWAAMHGIAALYIGMKNDRKLPMRKPEDVTDLMLDSLMRGMGRDV